MEQDVKGHLLKHARRHLNLLIDQHREVETHGVRFLFVVSAGSSAALLTYMGGQSNEGEQSAFVIFALVFSLVSLLSIGIYYFVYKSFLEHYLLDFKALITDIENGVVEGPDGFNKDERAGMKKEPALDYLMGISFFSLLLVAILVALNFI